MDPIADMLTRIRNAQAVGLSTVNIPFSRIKFSLAKILVKEGFIKKAEKKGRGIQRKIELILQYEDDKKMIPRIQILKRISKSGQRIYTKKKWLDEFSKKHSIAILSTSQGLMTDRESKKKGVGGEILCEIR